MLLYLAKAGSSDNLLYAWILQFGAGIGLYVNTQQIARLFTNQGFIIGTLR